MYFVFSCLNQKVVLVAMGFGYVLSFIVFLTPLISRRVVCKQRPVGV
jgi:hypothetical protein